MDIFILIGKIQAGKQRQYLPAPNSLLANEEKETFTEYLFCWQICYDSTIAIHYTFDDERITILTKVSIVQ